MWLDLERLGIKDSLLKQKLSRWDSDGSMCRVNQMINTLAVLCCQNLVTAPVRTNANIFAGHHDSTLLYKVFYIAKGVHILLIDWITARKTSVSVSISVSLSGVTFPCLLINAVLQEAGNRLLAATTWSVYQSLWSQIRGVCFITFTARGGRQKVCIAGLNVNKEKWHPWAVMDKVNVSNLLEESMCLWCNLECLMQDEGRILTVGQVSVV